MIIYAPFSTKTNIALRQPTLDFLSGYMENNKSDILISKDCTDSDYLYEQGFTGIIKQYPKDDIIIIEQDVVPTDSIMLNIKADNADVVENAYQAISDKQFNERLLSQTEKNPLFADRLPKENKSVIYAFGICKINNKVLLSYLDDKNNGILPDNISWIQFYDIFYAWYLGLAYNGKKFIKKNFTPISQLNNEVAIHNKA
jgi:hypothetical protein